MTDPRLCLALDVPDAEQAGSWVRRTRRVFGTYKIGLQLFCAEGPAVIAAVREAGALRIFLDLKLHDIPNTVAGAVRSVGRLGVDELTVHLGGGPAMLEAAQDAAEAAGLSLLGVTVLTSLDAASLRRAGTDTPLDAVIDARAHLAAESGIAGLVCSAVEVGRLRAAHPMRLVTPGIRLTASRAGDQKRVATPDRALADGADMLVIGRAVTAAADLGEALSALEAAVGPARPAR